MGDNGRHPGLLPDAIPTGVVVAIAILALAAWALTHVLKRRGHGRSARAAFFLVRVLVGCGALWLTFNALGRGLLLATTWSLWVAALVGAAATESAAALYGLERRTVSRAAGAALVALRLAMTLLVVVMLVQPVFSRDETRTLERHVAVLLDDSASMHLVDHQMSVAEKFQLFEMFRPEAPRRPYGVDETVDALGGVRQRLAAQADWLGLLKHAAFDVLKNQLGDPKRRASMKELFEDALRTTDEQLAELAKVEQLEVSYDKKTLAALKDIRAKLAGRVREPLGACLKICQAGSAEDVARGYPELVARIGVAEQTLRALGTRLPAVVDRVEEAYFDSLPEARRKEIDAAVLRPRLAIAREAVLGAADEDVALLGRLEDAYSVKFYRFASEPADADLDAWRSRVDAVGTDPESQPPSAQSTNLAAAVARAHADIPPDKLAGVLLLTDGRHNAKTTVDAVAQRLGIQKSPVCSVLVGSTRPPPDASITGVVAPQTVYVEDMLVVEAGLKFDGLRGKDALVKLLYDGKTVDQQSLRVLSDSYRITVGLSHTPKEKGLREYRIDVQPFETEKFQANNARPVHIAVTDDRTKLLIIEGRPRWEFRYLRNLFAGRDKTVQLQHVLLHPDWIADTSPRLEIPASVSRKPDAVEATALPDNEEEWLKFDVVVLGDVSPEVLGEKEMGIIETFVAERGGSLIVIAGPRHMPHAFADTPLKDLLPVNVAPVDDVITAGPEPCFRIALTDVGRDHVVMRLSDVMDDNLRVWRSRPEIYWRHPVEDTKPGATVLAFAMPMEPPDVFRLRRTSDPVEARRIERKRREYQRRNALIAVQNYALGRVMTLAFDRTWRLRYRVGDTYHHKFWGQVLRWATSDKLQAGTDRVRLGTDRTLYAPDENVYVRAKILLPAGTDAKEDEVAVNVYDGDQRVLRKVLDPVEGGAGTYHAELGALPPGRRYRIVLDSKLAARQLLAGEGVNKVQTEVLVTPAHSGELIELSAHRAVLSQLAFLTGGVVAGPHKAAAVIDSFGLGTREVVEQKEYLLWNSWPLLLIIIVLATAEWILRKKVGLT
jgi:hypothetical protein